MAERLYFIGIVPPAPLQQDIRQRQETVARDYGVYTALQSPPHIPLVAPFPFEEALLPILHEELTAGLHTFPTFTIVLRGHGFFEPHTLFLHVLSNRYLRLLEDQLHTLLHIRFPATQWKDRRRFHPHIALARKDVEPEVFFQLYKQYSSKPFHASFIVEHYVLLEWRDDVWTPVKLLPLKPRD